MPELTQRDELEIEILNIMQWKSKGYTGKEYKYLELEQDKTHGQMVVNTFKALSDAQCFLMTDADSGLGYWDNRKHAVNRVQPDIVGLSMSASDSQDGRDFIDWLYEQDIPIILSAGNEGEIMANRIAQNDKAICVGSVSLYKDATWQRANYSNYGDELDFVAPTLYSWAGTSFSQPVFAAMCTILMSKYGKMNHDQLYRYFKEHALDLKDKGFDIWTGYGVARLDDVDKDWRIEMLPIKYRPCKTQRITSGFGWRELYGKQQWHYGMDISPINDYQEPIIAVADGEIIKSYYSDTGGNMVIIQHNGFQTRYLHLQEVESLEGAHVKAGNVIGHMGNTGRLTTGEHLHFDIKVDGNYINPTKYIILPFEIIESEEKMTEERVKEIVTEMLQGLGTMPSEWAKEELTEAIAKGITDGKRPKGVMTREEGAIMALRSSKVEDK